jgi:hypothetical protein
LRRAKSIYLRPEQWRWLDDACLDLPAVLREPMSPSKVLERIVDAVGRRWVADTLKGRRPAKGRKR